MYLKTDVLLGGNLPKTEDLALNEAQLGTKHMFISIYVCVHNYDDRLDYVALSVGCRVWLKACCIALVKCFKCDGLLFRKKSGFSHITLIAKSLASSSPGRRSLQD